MIIAIDFDGTLVENKYPLIGKEKSHAVDVLHRLGREHELILWTCRVGQQFVDAVEWCKTRNLPFTSYNKDTPSIAAQFGVPNTNYKVFADIYIDDRNLMWYNEEVDWWRIEKILEQRGVLPINKVLCKSK